jgi:hypothetical protein
MMEESCTIFNDVLLPKSSTSMTFLALSRAIQDSAMLLALAWSALIEEKETF